MSEKDKSHHHSMKLIFIFIVWSLALYAAVRIVKISEKSSESSEPLLASRPPVLPVKHRGVCKSPECITLAHQLHNWRDVSVDPCEDFYQAVCGKYNEHTVTKASKFGKNTQLLIQLIGEFLRKKQVSDSKSEKAMHLVFDKCVEYKTQGPTGEANTQKAQELLTMINRIGKWPMAHKHWRDSEFHLNDMLKKMASVGVSDFGFFQIEADSRLSIEGPSAIQEIDPNSIEMEFTEILKLNGLEVDSNMIKHDVKDMIILFKRLQRTANHPGDTSFGTFDQLENNLSVLKFEKIIKAMMNPTRRETNWPALKDKIVTYAAHPYFSNEMESLQSIIATTHKRTLANFLIYHVKLYFDSFSQVLERETCTKMVILLYPLASIRVFTRNHSDKENLKIVSDMVEDLKESITDSFLESTWLHESTKRRAIRKVELMKKMIGYPKELEVPGSLDTFFDNLNLSDTDSYHTVMSKTVKFQWELKLDYVTGHLPIQPHFSFVTSGAFYKPELNMLMVTVAFLHPSVFDSTFPKYAKVASVGAVIGHEIGHGFDVGGRRRDENGNLNDWWTTGDSEEYDKRSQCLVDHFNNYDDPDFGKQLNGSRTIREHAADLIGVSTSLKTYNKVDFANEPSIFGFEDEKPDKLFFHITALNWCRPREQTPLAAQLRRVHPTSSFRVNGIFSNMKQFAEAFNCPVGSPMNPEKKCELF